MFFFLHHSPIKTLSSRHFVNSQSKTLSIPGHFANIAQLIQLNNFPKQFTTTNTNINLPMHFNQSKCATSPVYHINQNAPTHAQNSFRPAPTQRNSFPTHTPNPNMTAPTQRNSFPTHTPNPNMTAPITKPFTPITTPMTKPITNYTHINSQTHRQPYPRQWPKQPTQPSSP